jgi:hypothetical protein
MRLASGRRVFVTVVLAVLQLGVACARKEAPEAPPAPPTPAAPPPAPVVRDAAPDIVDAAADVADARGGGKRAPAGHAAGEGGGAGGMKVTGSLARAEGEKVVHAAQAQLRACFEHASPKGAGHKGRVSFKLTIDDRGHVIATDIPSSTLEGGSEVETCMGHVLRDLRFPRGSGESTISFQMSFGR